jgi:hypothetical protein
MPSMLILIKTFPFTRSSMLKNYSGYREKENSLKYSEILFLFLKLLETLQPTYAGA